MDKVTGIIFLAGSLIFSAVLLVLAFSPGKFAANNIRSAMADLQQIVSVENSDFDRVKNDTVSGVEVISLLQRFDSSGYQHLVVTSGCEEGFYNIDGVNDVHSDYYINPVKLFTGSVVQDRNDNVYAIKFVEHGLQDVGFDQGKADSVGKSIDSEILEAQYGMFQKFLVNRAKCNEFLQLCKNWAEAAQRLEKAELQNVYDRYSGVEESRDESIEFQISSFQESKRFYEAVTTAVNTWRENQWWEAILTLNGDSSEEYEEYDSEESDGSGSGSNWWESDPGADYATGRPDVDSDSSGADNNSDDVGAGETSAPSETPNVITPKPDGTAIPTPSDMPVVTDAPGDTAVPIATP